MTLKSIRRSGHTGIVMINKQLVASFLIPLLASAFTDQASTKQALIMAMGANAKQTMPYQWKQKITVVRKGNPMPPIIELLRFDATGQMQRMTISRPEEKKMGPLKARKAAGVKEDVQAVMQMAGRYANPQTLRDAIEKGEIWEGQGYLRVQARSLFIPIDEMIVVVSGSNFLPAKIDCKTQYEGSPVTIAVDYGQMPNGPSVMTRMTVQIPGEDIVVNVESFDHVKLAASNFQ